MFKQHSAFTQRQADRAKRHPHHLFQCLGDVGAEGTEQNQSHRHKADAQSIVSELQKEDSGFLLGDIANEADSNV